jgi:hypothetical protein
MQKHLLPSDNLKRMVESLEEKIKIQEEYLKYEVHDLLQSLKPGNLIKNAIHNVIEDPRARRTAIGAGLGMAAVALSKTIVSRSISTIGGKMVSTVFNFIGKKSKKKKRWNH